MRVKEQVKIEEQARVEERNNIEYWTSKFYIKIDNNSILLLNENFQHILIKT